jgi:hypothetical protein
MALHGGFQLLLGRRRRKVELRVEGIEFEEIAMVSGALQ